jgi:serine phosphatase RsbU (regulator of sigma subunit)/anti-sigma regulatory factor (Ser/Thr protein kinase)
MTAVAVAYFGTAKVGLELAGMTPSVTAIWPPAGVALAALILGGKRLWPAVAVAAFAANATTDVPLYTALGIAVGNTLEAVVGASLLGWIGFRPTMARLRDVFGLVVLAGIFSTTISATVGIASLELGDSIAGNALSVWRVWWLGDMGGVLLVAPFLLVAITHWPYRQVPGRALEALALVGGLTAVGALVFSGSSPLGYLTFPFYIWGALRFLQPGATTVALIVAALAVALTSSGDSQFVVSSEDDSLALAQTFSAVVGLSALILAAVTSQRRRAERDARKVAHALQSELLPPALPDIPEIETAAWYRAGMLEQEVGGDFYDVFETGPGRWMAVIGDVCGKGPEAASLTALARYTLRAVGRDPREPSAALRTLNSAILEQRSDRRFMTVAAVGILAEPDGHAITVSCGGHPLPLLVRASGEVSEVGAVGTLLGVYPDPRLADRSVELAPGDALVLFTDGLDERRDPRAEPRRRIRDALRASKGASAREIASRVQAIALLDGDAAGDDIALLVLRRAALDGRSPVDARAPGDTERGVIELELEPAPESAPRARQAFSALREELAPDVYADLALVLTELVTNGIRHGRTARGESIRVRAALASRMLRIEVTDHGPGFEPGRPRPAADGSGGWGLFIARRLADRWGVDRDGSLTTVWIEKDLEPVAGRSSL